MFWLTISNALIVLTVVMLHYEFLSRMSVWLPARRDRGRVRIVLGVCGALVAHTLEIWLFAVAYYLMHHSGKWGYLARNFDGSLLDCVYFSFTAYTTLGFGDIEPFGHLRFLVGLEALTGFVLITWTASFLFIEMQKNWNRTS